MKIKNLLALLVEIDIVIVNVNGEYYQLNEAMEFEIIEIQPYEYHAILVIIKEGDND